MISLVGLSKFLLDALRQLGKTQSEFETILDQILTETGGDVERAGRLWMSRWVPELERVIGDPEVAKATAAAIFSRAFGSRPGYNPDHGFTG